MKKCIKAMVLAAVLVAMPVSVFAAVSPGHSGGGGGGSSHGSSSSSGTTITAGAGQAASTTVTSQVVVASDGSKLTVSGVTTDASGVSTGLAADKCDAGVDIATGAAKTAGLPAEAVAVIEAVDNGNLAAVPGVDLTGKTAYGASAAVRAEAGNQTVALYVSNLPAGAAVQVLFYNNATGTWSVLEATANADSTVTFVAPYSGTAKVIG